MGLPETLPKRIAALWRRMQELGASEAVDFDFAPEARPVVHASLGECRDALAELKQDLSQYWMNKRYKHALEAMFDAAHVFLTTILETREGYNTEAQTYNFAEQTERIAGFKLQWIDSAVIWNKVDERNDLLSKVLGKIVTRGNAGEMLREYLDCFEFRDDPHAAQRARELFERGVERWKPCLAALGIPLEGYELVEENKPEARYQMSVSGNLQGLTLKINYGYNKGVVTPAWFEDLFPAHEFVGHIGQMSTLRRQFAQGSLPSYLGIFPIADPRVLVHESIGDLIYSVFANTLVEVDAASRFQYAQAIAQKLIKYNAAQLAVEGDVGGAVAYVERFGNYVAPQAWQSFFEKVPHDPARFYPLVYGAATLAFGHVFAQLPQEKKVLLLKDMMSDIYLPADALRLARDKYDANIQNPVITLAVPVAPAFSHAI